MPAQLDLKSNSFGRLDTLASGFKKPQKNGIDTILKLHGLSDKTIKSYKCCYNQFNKSGLSIEQFLLQTKNKRNALALFRLLYPDETKGFKFPRRIWKPKMLPNREQIKTFYDALPEKYQPIFVLLYESGLH